MPCTCLGGISIDALHVEGIIAQGFSDGYPSYLHLATSVGHSIGRDVRQRSGWRCPSPNSTTPVQPEDLAQIVNGHSSGPPGRASDDVAVVTWQESQIAQQEGKLPTSTRRVNEMDNAISKSCKIRITCCPPRRQTKTGRRSKDDHTIIRIHLDVSSARRKIQEFISGQDVGRVESRDVSVLPKDVS